MKTFYVSMTDKFFSGWGRATDKVKKLVIRCDSHAEVVQVCENAHKRHEMNYICVNNKIPRYDKNKVITSYHDKTTYPNWFVPQPDWE